MPKDKSRKRVEKLFSDMKQLALNPPNGNDQQQIATNTDGSQFTGPAMLLQKEVDVLRARVLELETRLSDEGTKKLSASIIYE